MEAIAKHDFSATADDELSFRKLQVLKDDVCWRNHDNPNKGRHNDEEIKRGRVEPGGFNDPLKRGLSGALIRWYKRYLDQGLPPDVARQQALTHKKIDNDGADQATRKISKSPPPLKEPTPSKSLRSPLLSVAIVPKYYPEEHLCDKDLHHLQEFILHKVSKGYTAPLIFEGVFHRPGYLLVNCQDESTAHWLHLMIKEQGSFKDIELKTCVDKEIPRLFDILTVLPQSRGQSLERALALIKAQNFNCNTSVWKVINYKEQINGELLHALIDETSIKTIEKAGRKLNYKFGRIPVTKMKLHKWPQ